MFRVWFFFFFGQLIGYTKHQAMSFKFVTLFLPTIRIIKHQVEFISNNYILAILKKD